MKRSYENCVGRIVEASKDSISKAQAEELLSQIDEVAEKNPFNDLDTLDKKMQDILKNASRSLKESSLLQKRNALINAMVEKQILGQISNFNNPGDGLAAVLAGSVKAFKGARDSVDARGKALTTKYMGQFIRDLEVEGLEEHFASGKMDLDIVRELWELPNGKPGVTKNLEAQKIASIINKYQNDLVNRQNMAGAFIKLMPGYIVRQSHNIISLRKAGYAAWRDAVIDKLDPEKTFKGMDPDEFLREAYNGLSTGQHLKNKAENASADDAVLFGFTGPANLAKRVSSERALHFKSAEAWQEYNQLFGTRELRESVIAGFEYGARNLALLEKLGTNPEAMVERVRNQLIRDNSGDDKIVRDLRSATIDNIMAELTGKTKVPGGNITAARIGFGWRVVNNLAKLGGATLSSITDIPFQAALLRDQGQSLLHGYANAFHNIFRGRGDAETKQIARSIGVGLDGIISDIASRFSAEDTMPGMMAKMQQRFFKLNLMAWWNDSHKTGVGLMIANDLAEQAHLPWDKLRPDLAKSLENYSIAQREWDLIRETVYTAENGHKYITPDKIDGIDLDRVKKALNLPKNTKASAVLREATKLRNDINTALQTYIVDSADYAIPTPGAYEKALFNQGTQTGTALGEALRYVAQFKSFPVVVLRKGIGKELYKDGANDITEALFKGKGDMLGLAHLMVATTLFGYAAMAAKDVFKGREPRDIKDPDTWKAAMLQGGGLGIYGDFILGEYSRHGNSFWATILGPTASTVEDLMGLKTAIMRGEDSGAKAMKILINNTPFINLFYTRAAMDYLFLYQLQESLNPGYLRRLEQSIMRENNQQFYVPPSSVVPYGG